MSDTTHTANTMLKQRRRLISFERTKDGKEKRKYSYYFNAVQMKHFCNKLCQEQREICYNDAEYYTPKLDEVLYSNMPQLDLEDVS